MEFDYLKRYLDYSGAFNEVFGYVESLSDHCDDNVEVERIFDLLIALKDDLDRKYMNEV